VEPIDAWGRSSFKRSQYRSALGKARAWIDFKHTHCGIGPSRGPRLPDCFSQARRSRDGRILDQRELITRWRTKPLDREAKHFHGSWNLAQPGNERQSHTHLIGQRLAEYDLVPPRSPLLHEDGREDDGPKRSAAALAAGEEAIDE
jgi:hypothetical protein